jgi:flagellar protein FlaG
MGIDVTAIGSTGPEPPLERAARPAPAVFDAAAISPGEVPDGPPPEVLDAVGAAARAYEELHAEGRELRFDLDADSGHVTVEVRDLDGHVLRTIPPSQALDVATGSPLD